MIRSPDFYRGLVLGLGIMYVMDPDLGRSRRARVPGLRLLTGIVGLAALALGSARIAARIRSDQLEEIENEMPEYAMLR